MGDPDEKTDQMYEEALESAIEKGVNVIDSAINYRCQRSERSFGKRLAKMVQDGKVKREELILCTKGGFIPFDGSYPRDPGAYFKTTYLDPGILKPEDVAQGCHSLSPRYLETQLEKSLENLGVETIDIYYLHNPETQLEDIDRREFLDRMQAAFEWLEKKVSEGKIQMYGTATWNGYRVDPEAIDYLSLEDLMVTAREAGGPQHYFKVVQLPVNLAMLEAWVFPNQVYGPNRVPFLRVAEKYDLVTIGSASLLQARLAGDLPEFFTRNFEKLPKSSQKSLQLARSVPGMSVSLVGMRTKQHVEENLEVVRVPPLSESELLLIFQKKSGE